jgi:hypothetical protein
MASVSTGLHDAARGAVGDRGLRERRPGTVILAHGRVDSGFLEI